MQLWTLRSLRKWLVCGDKATFPLCKKCKTIWQYFSRDGTKIYPVKQVLSVKLQFCSISALNDNRLGLWSKIAKSAWSPSSASHQHQLLPCQQLNVPTVYKLLRYVRILFLLFFFLQTFLSLNSGQFVKVQHNMSSWRNQRSVLFFLWLSENIANERRLEHAALTVMAAARHGLIQISTSMDVWNMSANILFWTGYTCWNVHTSLTSTSISEWQRPARSETSGLKSGSLFIRGTESEGRTISLHLMGWLTTYTWQFIDLFHHRLRGKQLSPHYEWLQFV